MMLWTPQPERIRSYRQTGRGDMGSIADDKSLARFAMRTVEVDGVRRDVAVWNLIAVRGRFVGGSGSAELVLRIDHHDISGLYDWTLRRWPNIGETSPDLLHRASDEADLWATYPFFADDEIVFEWMNPDPGNMRWAMEVFLAYAALVPAGGRSER